MKKLSQSELKEFLDEKAALYNSTSFIETDPIQIPHHFSIKEDIEIAGFLIATIAWGNRKSIINNGGKLLEIMGNSPLDFVMEYANNNRSLLNGFVHRTFNENDLDYFFKSIQNLYKNHKGMEAIFSSNATSTSLQPAISEFKKVFFELPHESRTQKHVSDPLKNSAAKRINILTHA